MKGSYYSQSKAKWQPIAAMPTAHLRNAAAKLKAESCNERLCAEDRAAADAKAAELQTELDTRTTTTEE